jgi:hypothetical protein
MATLGAIGGRYLHGCVEVDKLPISMDADDVARLEVSVHEPLPLAIVVQVP